MRERGILFVMAALILWMGIGSPFFTRRTETYYAECFAADAASRRHTTPVARTVMA